MDLLFFVGFLRCPDTNELHVQVEDVNKLECISLHVCGTKEIRIIEC